MYRLMIVEDDPALGMGIRLALQTSSIKVVVCRSISEAKQNFDKFKFGLIILDINLPDGNGLDFLVEIREKSDVPVIILTINDMEIDIVTGLELGANDYMTKPFSLAVLKARVNAQLRQSSISKSRCIKIGEFDFDFDKMEFSRNGCQIELSKTEQKLLWVLINNRGNAVSRADLVDRIWTDGAEYVDENALSVTMKRLRNKLEYEPSKPVYLKTVYGFGYMWEVK